MGAYIGMQACALAPDRLRSVTLIDAIGFPEPASMPPILGTIEPWSPHWDERVRDASAVDVDGDHYGVLMHQGTFEAIGRFLS